jgi:hypothetical protein
MLGRPLDDLLGFRSSQSSSSSNGVSTQGVSEELSSLRRLMRVPAVKLTTIAVVTNSQSILSVVIVGGCSGRLTGGLKNNSQCAHDDTVDCDPRWLVQGSLRVISANKYLSCRPVGSVRIRQSCTRQFCGTNWLWLTSPPDSLQTMEKKWENQGKAGRLDSTR